MDETETTPPVSVVNISPLSLSLGRDDLDTLVEKVNEIIAFVNK